MSPEQANGKEVDQRTDIFSAGIVLWELLTLESCFLGDTDLKLLQRVRQGKIKDPSLVNRKIPKNLADIVMQALQRKPKKRFQTASEFAEMLEVYQEEFFGKVSEADLAAFVRNLFNIPPEELAHVPESISPQKRNLIASGIDQALTETQHGPSTLPSGSFDRGSFFQQVQDSISWFLKYPIMFVLIGALGLSLWIKPPIEWFQKFDAQILRFAKAIHQLREAKKEEEVEVNIIELHAPTAPKPLYALQFSPEAQEHLDDLPFELFDEIRDRASDLAFDPQPPTAISNSKRPGSWAVLQSGHSIFYVVDPQLRTVVIEKIKKTKG